MEVVANALKVDDNFNVFSDKLITSTGITFKFQSGTDFPNVKDIIKNIQPDKGPGVGASISADKLKKILVKNKTLYIEVDPESGAVKFCCDKITTLIMKKA